MPPAAFAVAVQLRNISLQPTSETAGLSSRYSESGVVPVPAIMKCRRTMTLGHSILNSKAGGSAFSAAALPAISGGSVLERDTVAASTGGSSVPRRPARPVSIANVMGLNFKTPFRAGFFTLPEAAADRCVGRSSLSDNTSPWLGLQYQCTSFQILHCL